MHNDIKTEHYAMLHVQHSGEGLGVIPHHLRTLKVVEAALQVPGLLLRHTPLELLNEALLIKMMRRDGWELQFVPREMRTRKVLETALYNEGLAITFVSFNQLDEELAIIAVIQNGLAIKYLTPELSLIHI